mmetsp:Transcript_88280/g.152627  ORF Transcript_88280/g.152627 Transcript_88280/m.152627 type:complete len:515 (+) Transcript_88280:39-1583(+)
MAFEEVSSLQAAPTVIPKACCFGHLTRRGCALLVLLCAACSIGFTLLGVNTIGKSIAADGIRKAAISFDSIDVGALNGSDTLHARIVGVVTKPSPFNAKFYAATARIKMVGGAHGKLIDVGTAWLPELHVGGGEDLNLDISVKLQVEHPEAFGKAGQRFVADSESSWGIEASVNVFCWAFGILPIYLRGVPFAKTVTLKGMSGFSQSANPITMERLGNAYGRPGVLEVGVVVNIYNPSYMAAHIIPEMQFNVTQRGKDFGIATISDVHFRPGRNEVFAQFQLHNNPHNQDAVEQFILGFLRAETQPVAMCGSEWSTSDPFLRVILEGLTLAFNFQAPEYQFIHAIEATFDFHGLRALANIYNPLPDKIIFGHMAMNVNEGSVEGENIFQLDTDKDDTRIPGQILKPDQRSDLNIKLSLWNAHLTDPAQLIRLVGSAKNGSILVGVKGPVTITIAPSFQLTVEYSRNNVTAILKCPVWCRPHDSHRGILNDTMGVVYGDSAGSVEFSRAHALLHV